MSGVCLPQKRDRARRLNTGQVAQILGVTPKTVRRYITSGMLAAYSNVSDSPQGVRYLVDEGDLERFRAQYAVRLVCVSDE